MSVVNEVEQTGKSVKSLENAIQYLLERSKQVNQMLEEEKTRQKVKKQREIDILLKKPITASSLDESYDKSDKTQPLKLTPENNSSKTQPTKPVEVSMVPRISSAVKPVVKVTEDVLQASKKSNPSGRTTSTIQLERRPKRSELDFDVTTLPFEKSTTTVSESQISQTKGWITLKEKYTIEGENGVEEMPAMARVCQNKDGSMYVVYTFLDNNEAPVLEVRCDLNGKQVSNVTVNNIPLHQEI